MTEQDVRNKLAGTFSAINQAAPAFHGDLLSQAASAYERRHKRPLSSNLKAVLQKTLTENARMLQQKGTSRQAIQSAAEDIGSVDNPISMLFNLISILVPNYAFNEVVGIQPMPSDPSPIYYPQLTAAESRNNVAAGTVLLGSTNWNQNMNYTTDKVVETLTISGTSVSKTLTNTPKLKGAIVTLNLDGTTYTLVSDKDGKFPELAGVTSGEGTIDTSTKAVSITLAASATSATGTINYKYEPAAGQKPAQAKFEWATKSVSTDRYQIRSVYSLENFYAAKQVLADYNIDEAMSTSLAGYINAEISQGIFDDILAQADATYAWNSALPTGVSWATHRLSVLQTLVASANGIRANVQRSGGDTITADTSLMNVIETLGKDLWTPEAYTSEPVGPYLAGKLAGKFKVIKNQQYPTGQSAMTFKRDDTDASVIAGVFIGLFATNPLVLDDLTSVSGMGCKMGTVKVFDNSVARISVK